MIRQLLELGVIVIAAGGGGIPVVRRDDVLEGVEAVVDKDLATTLLAICIDETTSSELEATLQLRSTTGLPSNCTELG